MINLVVLGGTGDVYMLAALLQAFKETHQRDAQLVVRQRYACVADLFPGANYVVGDAAIDEAERSPAMQRDYDNVIADGRNFYAHPSFFRTNVRIDNLTTKQDVSQADMYKVLLRIPWGVPLALPKLPDVPTQRGKVVVVPDARSWPNLHHEFWPRLCSRLGADGWSVTNNNASGWSLQQLLQNCAEAEWVIGPQCGVMSILVTGRFPCRKTLASSNIDNAPAIYPFSTHTFPYAYVTKYSNQDYDVEEFKIVGGREDELVDLIARGQNALRLWPHNPDPVVSINVPLTPGDFLDRLAVLTVKRERFDPPRRAAIEREYQRHNELYVRLRAHMTPEADALVNDLADLHRRNFDLLEHMVPEALGGGGMTPEDHVEAVRNNKARVELKQAIDAALHAPYSETKSYFREG